MLQPVARLASGSKGILEVPGSFRSSLIKLEALGRNGSTFQMLIEEVDGPGPGLFSRLFMVALRVGEVHEGVIRALICEELMDFTQAG